MRHLLWLPVLPLLGVALLVLEANGPTLTTGMAFALAALPALVALRQRKAALVLLAAGVAFIAWRLVRPGPTAVEACIDADCGPRRLAWGRVLDEREVTRAGLYLSGRLGAMRGAEFDAFDALLDRAWTSMPAEWSGVSNPLLMVSTATRVEGLRFRSARAGKRPAIVFLHGFGGLLTLYVEAIARGTHGELDVIAPALDPLGQWWSDRGLAVITRTLEQLPPDVDRERVFLVGLSNGGIGATEVLAHPELTRRFAGVVLLSGIGEVDAKPETRVLVVSGTKDPRFTGEWVRDQVKTLEARQADVTWARFDADHFLLLTHATEWTRAFRAWAAP